MIERLESRRVVVCAGAGGVGKTTVSAAIALGLARRGRRVALITIDPARRLADALGVAQLGNEPVPVAPEALALHGVEAPGELWAMTLDPRQTFDDLVGELAADERTRDEVLGNRVYRQLVGAVAGAQEYGAMAKLHQLAGRPEFDVIVLDTPPSRSAIAFLDAPERVTAMLESGGLRTLVAPTGLTARIAARGSGAVLAVLTKLTGSELVDDLRAFFRSVGGLLDGFGARAEAVGELLADDSTAFLVIASPERERVDEAIYLNGALAARDLHLGGVVVNRTHSHVEPAIDLGEPALERKVARAVAEVNALAARDAAAVERLRRELGDDAPAIVPHLAADVHDLDRLAELLAHLDG